MKYRLTEDWLEYKKGQEFFRRENGLWVVINDDTDLLVANPVSLSLLLKTGILEEVKEIEIVPSGRIDYCCECGNDHGYDCPLLLVKEKLEEAMTLLLSLKK